MDTPHAAAHEGAHTPATVADLATLPPAFYAFFEVVERDALHAE